MEADVSATGVSLLHNLKPHSAIRATVMLQLKFIASFTLFSQQNAIAGALFDL